LESSKLFEQARKILRVIELVSGVSPWK